jgi:hypothetical protein
MELLTQAVDDFGYGNREPDRNDVGPQVADELACGRQWAHTCQGKRDHDRGL